MGLLRYIIALNEVFRGVFMHANPKRRTLTDIQDLRREGGRWLKERRERLGLTQLQISKLVGSPHYSFVSYLENGRTRIPPERYPDWAHVFGMSELDFVREMLRYYDPVTFDILFAPDDKSIDGPEPPSSPPALPNVWSPNPDRPADPAVSLGSQTDAHCQTE
jgi:transcriptional regulator with XRE-family HTH domain